MATKSTATTLTQNDINNKTNALNYAINSKLMNVNTVLPCRIYAISGIRYDITPIINVLDARGQPHINPNVHDVPAMQIVGGNAGIIIEYQVGDIVCVGFSQRDISNIKYSWTTQNPASYRKHAIADAIILGKLSNTTPTINIKITAAGIEINAPSLPVTVNAQTVTVAATTVNVNSNSVNLGGAGGTGVLNSQAIITAPPGGGVCSITNFSTKVKAIL
jgi:hypothetical protein